MPDFIAAVLAIISARNRLVCWYMRTAIWLLNTLLAIATLWLVFVVINVALAFAVPALRVAPPPGSLRYDPALLAQAYPDWSATERTAMLLETWQRPFVCDGNMPSALFGETPYHGRYVNVTEHGYRCNAYCPPWPMDSGALNVWVFGGSTTFGYGVADWETIPARLEETLNAASPDRRVNVYNWGVVYYYSAQEFARLSRLLIEGHTPDLVLFIDGVNEFVTGPIAQFRLICGQDASAQLPGFEWPLLRVYRALFGPRPQKWANNDIRSADALTRWEQTRRAVRGLAWAYDFETLFVWQPVPGFAYNLDYHPFADSVLWVSSPAQQAGYHQLARGLFDDLPDMLWLGAIQAGRDEVLYVDSVHYTAAFGREIAGRIAASAVELSGG